MIKLFECPVCASRDLRCHKSYRFSKPRHASYADCPDYVQRRLWLTFLVVDTELTVLEFDVLQCRSCDLLFTNPRFEDAEIERKYAFLVQHGSTGKEYAAAPVTGLARRARRIHRLIERFQESASENMAIADLGGQFGHNLSEFDSKRYRKYVIDFESYDLYDDVSYVAPDFLPCSDYFDVILANHIVEHLNAPATVLARAAQSLKQGGLIYLEVPLGAFREADALHEPISHCNFFSEKSLCRLAEQAGLVTVFLQTRFQWVTQHAEWCVNLIARKGAGAGELSASAMTAREARHRPRYMGRLVADRLHRRVWGIALGRRMG